MPVGHGEVQPAIQIDIKKSAAETKAIAGGDAYSRLRRDILETLSAQTVETDHLVIEVCDRDTGRTGIIEVRYVDSHARAGFSFSTERKPSFHRGIFECAIALIAIKLVGLSVIGHEQIGPAVIVVLEQCYSQRFGAAVENSARRRHIFERAIAAVMKEPAGGPAIRFR